LFNCEGIHYVYKCPIPVIVERLGYGLDDLRKCGWIAVNIKRYFSDSKGSNQLEISSRIISNGCWRLFAWD